MITPLHLSTYYSPLSIITVYCIMTCRETSDKTYNGGECIRTDVTSDSMGTNVEEDKLLDEAMLTQDKSLILLVTLL